MADSQARGAPSKRPASTIEGPDGGNKLWESCVELGHWLESYEYDEKANITRDLESGSHWLVMESNDVTNAKCRAKQCLVQALSNRYDERIRSPYRINLFAKNPSREHWSQLDTPNRRFYHVSCFEAIGVDMTQHLQLTPRLTPGLTSNGHFAGTRVITFHSAITDWFELKGRTFDARLYKKSTAFKAALKSYHKEHDARRIWTPPFAGERGSELGPEPEPAPPKSTDFIDGTPSAHSLTDVLVDVLGGRHLLHLENAKLMVLEVWGEVPDSLTKSALRRRGQAAPRTGSAGEADATQEDTEIVVNAETGSSTEDQVDTSRGENGGKAIDDATGAETLEASLDIGEKGVANAG